jgi:chromosome partitioning protein
LHERREKNAFLARHVRPIVRATSADQAGSRRCALRTICVVNQKGGSGKTATTVSVAAALGEQGLRALVIDLDPQASATRWLGAADDRRDLLDAFLNESGFADLVVQTQVPGVDLIPGSTWLAQLERNLAGEAGAEMIFQRGLMTLEKRWDAVLVDCPPSLGFLVVSALTACREVLVPLESPEALDGLKDLLKTIGKVRERLNPGLSPPRVLLCRVASQTNLWRELATGLRQRLGDAVLKACVHDTIKVKESYSHRRPITLYAPSSIAAADYRKVATELFPWPVPGPTTAEHGKRRTGTPAQVRA